MKGGMLIPFSQRNSNYLIHAKDKWAIAFPGDDEIRAQMGVHVLDMVAIFGLEGHSGFSASYARQYIDKALRFEPFSPLTEAACEWRETYDWDGPQQPNRCTTVFRHQDGASDGITVQALVEDSGAHYTYRDIRMPHKQEEP